MRHLKGATPVPGPMRTSGRLASSGGRNAPPRRRKMGTRGGFWPNDAAPLLDSSGVSWRSSQPVATPRLLPYWVSTLTTEKATSTCNAASSCERRSEVHEPPVIHHDNQDSVQLLMRATNGKAMDQVSQMSANVGRLRQPTIGRGSARHLLHAVSSHKPPLSAAQYLQRRTRRLCCHMRACSL